MSPNRQHDRERRPFAKLAAYSNRATVTLDYSLSNRQAQATRAARSTLLGGTVISLEHFIYLFGGDAHPMVSDRNRGSPAIIRKSDLNNSAWLGKVDCISHKILKGSAQPNLVTPALIRWWKWLFLH